jgi:hypothetical protein
LKCHSDRQAGHDQNGSSVVEVEHLVSVWVLPTRVQSFVNVLWGRTFVRADLHIGEYLTRMGLNTHRHFEKRL